MRILITGRTGYVAQSVKKYIKKCPSYDVDMLSVKGDDWKRTDFSKYDVLFHCAGVIPGNEATESDFYRINRDLTHELGIKAKADGVRQFVYLSSMAVYGIKPSVRKGEGVVGAHARCKPDTVYGKSKHGGEQLLLHLEDDKFRIAVIRSPSIYGPGSTAYLEQYHYLLNRLPMQPLAYLRCKRSALFIDNLSKLVLLIMDSGFHGIVCPADSPQLSAVEFVREIQKKQGKKKPFSNILGFALQAFFSNHPTVNRIWGSIAYDSSLTEMFDGKYKEIDSYKAIQLALQVDWDGTE